MDFVDSAVMRPLLATELLRAILGIADAQSGLISHEQLVSVGVGRWTIKRLRERGWLRLVHRGVYVVGHAALDDRARLAGAVLALAPDALVTHQGSLGWFGLLSRAENAPVHVTVLGRKCRSRPGIVVHYAERLDPQDVGRHHGIPVTLPARALLESATDLPYGVLERAVDEALAIELLDRQALVAVCDRYPGHRGAAVLRELAHPKRSADLSHSQAQKALTKLLRRARAPKWESEYPIGTYRADFAWPELHLVIEVDGRLHGDVKRRASDHRRSDALRHQEWVVVRFTAWEVIYRPEYVLLRIGQELAHAGWAELALVAGRG